MTIMYNETVIYIQLAVTSEQKICCDKLAFGFY